MATCRFCKNWNSEPQVKYGARHYAHWECYLKAGKPLSELADWKIIRCPYRLLKEYDLVSIAEAAQRRLDGEAAA